MLGLIYDLLVDKFLESSLGLMLSLEIFVFVMFSKT